MAITYLGGRRYLVIPAFVGYQAVQNLLPDGLFMLGGDAFVASFLNGRQPVLEGFVLPGRVGRFDLLVVFDVLCFLWASIDV